MNTLICPHCKKEVEISQALIHQLSEQVRIEEQKKAKAQMEKTIALERMTSEKKLREELQVESLQKEKEILEGKKREKELQEKLVKEHLEKKKIEIRIREEANKKAEDEQRLKLKEKDLQIEQIKKANDDIRRANEDLKRKLEQGSQQMQGEALELDLEEKLKSTFPNDEFLPIPKGVEGGDIWQKINYLGRNVGSILWETKRTKAWSNGWTTKLKNDAGKISASEAIIVSTILPNPAAIFDRKDGVWITTYEHAMSICRYVRFLITTVSTVRSSVSQTEEEWGKIRDYMMSDSFKHRMQAHFDGVKSLRESLEAEKRATTLRWKKQESQIDKLDTNSLNFYGDLKNIVSDLPEVKGIDSPRLILSDDKETYI